MKIGMLPRLAAALVTASVTLGGCAIVAERGYYGHHYHYRYYEPHPHHYAYPPGYHHRHRGHYRLQLEDSGVSGQTQQQITADIQAE